MHACSYVRMYLFLYVCKYVGSLFSLVKLMKYVCRYMYNALVVMYYYIFFLLHVCMYTVSGFQTRYSVLIFHLLCVCIRWGHHRLHPAADHRHLHPGRRPEAGILRRALTTSMYVCVYQCAFFVVKWLRKLMMYSTIAMENGLHISIYYHNIHGRECKYVHILYVCIHVDRY
jgi:hypothetical protein